MIKDTLFEKEELFLSEFAFKSKNATRSFSISSDNLRGEFQRDRDRILHSKAFRRLKYKTQVFLCPEGDHYRTRLTHTLEVMQIARTLARALRLNEDLVEAIALAHDLGHTPYGHAGERAINQFVPFHHSHQGIRVVEYIEGDGLGLNLTEQVKDGILNHSSGGKPNTLEAAVVSLSDRIAYINHDIDDAIRGGIIDNIPEKFLAILGRTHGERINSLVLDCIEHSQDEPKISQSERLATALLELRQFMFDFVYTQGEGKKDEYKAVNLVASLYGFYIKNIDLVPKFLLDKAESKTQAVIDHISTFTDRYAASMFRELNIPKNWQ